MTTTRSPSPWAMVGGILLLFVVGTPLVAYLWETLNRLLSGLVEPVRLGVSVPALLLLVVVLAYARRLLAGGREAGSGN